jgi:hypothetical protein
MAVADPWALGINAASNVLGKAVTPAPAAPTTSVSSGTVGSGGFDNSGWNVTFGPNSGIKSDRDQTAPATLQQAAAGLLGGNNMMYLLGGLVLWKMLHKKRG